MNAPHIHQGHAGARPLSTLLVKVSLLSISLLAQNCALADNISDYLSPHITASNVIDIRQWSRPAECVFTPDGGQDCLLSLAMAEGRGKQPLSQQVEASVYLRLRGGRVGQVIINGPSSHLVQVLDLLHRYYGPPIAAPAGEWQANSPCSTLSEWQQPEMSILLKACRKPGSHNGDGFTINLLADWYALAGQHR